MRRLLANQPQARFTKQSSVCTILEWHFKAFGVRCSQESTSCATLKSMYP